MRTLPPRLDSPFLYPGPGAQHLDLNNWRAREWKPALESAGIGHGTIYTLRHTAISNWLAAGIGSFEAARYAGTSIEMIDRHYGDRVLGAEDSARKRLDEWAESVPRAATSAAGDGGSIPLPD